MRSQKNATMFFPTELPFSPESEFPFAYQHKLLRKRSFSLGCYPNGGIVSPT
jgi:hypothetical protein